MASCWEKYPCVTTSIHALVQQVAVSQLRHGYVWYVTGTVPEGSQPEHVDETIITKYQLSKDWRYRADLKARGFANVEYLRHDRFYVIMATKGKHPFKIREAEKLRCARYGAKQYAPLLIPVKSEPRLLAKRKKNKKRLSSTFDGYEVSYRRGRYQRKTTDEKYAYQLAMQHWARNTMAGKKLPKPAKGEKDPKWHPDVRMERRSARKVEAFLINHALEWDESKLHAELHSLPFVAYWGVKQQLLLFLGRVNRMRKTHALPEFPYKTVLDLKRVQIEVFQKVDANRNSPNETSLNKCYLSVGPT